MHTDIHTHHPSLHPSRLPSRHPSNHSPDHPSNPIHPSMHPCMHAYIHTCPSVHPHRHRTKLPRENIWTFYEQTRGPWSPPLPGRGIDPHSPPPPMDLGRRVCGLSFSVRIENCRDQGVGYSLGGRVLLLRLRRLQLRPLHLQQGRLLSCRDCLEK